MIPSAQRSFRATTCSHHAIAAPLTVAVNDGRRRALKLKTKELRLPSYFFRRLRTQFARLRLFPSLSTPDTAPLSPLAVGIPHRNERTHASFAANHFGVFQQQEGAAGGVDHVKSGNETNCNRGDKRHVISCGQC